jgi:hypothetical protein
VNKRISSSSPTLLGVWWFHSVVSRVPPSFASSPPPFSVFSANVLLLFQSHQSIGIVHLYPRPSLSKYDSIESGTHRYTHPRCAVNTLLAFATIYICVPLPCCDCLYASLYIHSPSTVFRHPAPPFALFTTSSFCLPYINHNTCEFCI